MKFQFETGLLVRVGGCSERKEFGCIKWSHGGPMTLLAVSMSACCQRMEKEVQLHVPMLTLLTLSGEGVSKDVKLYLLLLLDHISTSR